MRTHVLRRSAAAAGAALLATAGFLVGFAAPAHAAATITDNGNGSFTVSGVPAGGGTNGLYLCSSAVSAVTCWNSGVPVGVLFFVPDPDANGTFTVGSAMNTFPGNAPTTLTAGTYRAITNNANAIDAEALVTFFAGGGGSSGSGAGSPPPELQQFGRPATGTCDAAQPTGLNWAGVPSGGWSESWAQWVNNRAGGYVCTRMVVYNTSRGVWLIG